TTVVFTVDAGIAATASGTLSNTATATVPVGVVDSDPTNNSSTDLSDIAAVADLTVSKTDNVTSLTPGNTVGYDITVVNNGPSAVVGASVGDVVPAAITAATWTCIPSAGASCGTSAGTGDVVTTADLPVGSSANVHLAGTVASGATGSVANTAIVAPPVDITDPNASNNTATDNDALDPVADVFVTKTNGITSQSPGATSVYTINVTDAGPSNAPG